MSVSIHSIKSSVSQAYGISVLDLDSARRSQDVAKPRQLAMYLARKLTKYSLPSIGSQFGGRDHTTVMHAVRVVEKKIEKNREFRNRVNAIAIAAENWIDVRASDADLDEAALNSHRNVVRQAKAVPGANVTAGDVNDLIRALHAEFGEAPVQLGTAADGGIFRLLVSTSGSWSIIEIKAGQRGARLIASGFEWLSDIRTSATPIKRSYDDAPKKADSKIRLCLVSDCREPFKSRHAGERYCPNCRVIMKRRQESGADARIEAASL